MDVSRLLSVGNSLQECCLGERHYLPHAISGMDMNTHALLDAPTGVLPEASSYQSASTANLLDSISPSLLLSLQSVYNDAANLIHDHLGSSQMNATGRSDLALHSPGHSPESPLSCSNNSGPLSLDTPSCTDSLADPLDLLDLLDGQTAGNVSMTSALMGGLAEKNAVPYRDCLGLGANGLQGSDRVCRSEGPLVGLSNMDVDTCNARHVLTGETKLKKQRTAQPFKTIVKPDNMSQHTSTANEDTNGRNQSLPRALLLNANLWLAFHQHGNEMIVSARGRSMFPVIRLLVSGLVPDMSYAVWIKLRRTDPHGFRWSMPEGNWVADHAQSTVDNTDSPLVTTFVHPESPALGSQWMRQPISFDKVKLTNNHRLAANGHGPTRRHVLLATFNRYQPVVYIAPNRPNGTTNDRRHMSHTAFSYEFPETSFYAVTQYRNPQITRLKVTHNPMAHAKQSI